MRLLTFLLSLVILSCQPENSSSPENLIEEAMPIKVVVVTMFERDEAQGDEPGELQYWVERFPFSNTIAFPQGNYNLYYNAEQGVLAITTGVGSINSAASIMALGMDERFDLTKAYWVVAGIAGADPEDMPLGSAAWAEWLVDGDLMHEIDAREIPDDWETGIFPLRETEPFPKETPNPESGAVFQLNPGLTEWAYQLTKDIALEDTEDLQQLRTRYANYPVAQQAPMVIKGDHLAAMTFWHGKVMDTWADRWVNYWTQGQGEFVTSAMEDTGTAQSLQLLDKTGKVDASRLLVLRTASNFTMPPDDMTAAESMQNENDGYSGFIPSLESAYQVGSAVVRNLVENWEQYQEKLPSVEDL
ncbi:MAG: purine nucleoside permease [Bacteroidota bacterium]